MPVTTTGLPKIYDYFDFTRAGRIDTSIVKQCEADDETVIIGLSGRKLKVCLFDEICKLLIFFLLDCL